MPLLKMENDSSAVLVGYRPARNVTNNTTMDLAVKCTMLANMEIRNSRNGCDRNQLKESDAPNPAVKHQLKKQKDVTMCTALIAMLTYAGSAWIILMT